MATKVIFVLLLAAAIVQAAEDPLAQGLEKDADNRLWVRMMQSLNIQADEDATYATIFAPTDRAVNTFLFEMGLSFDQLLARPVLVDQILSYHTIPGASITNMYSKNSGDGNKDLISNNEQQPTVMATGDPNAALQAYKSPITGLVALVDAQGNRAVVVGGGTKYGRVVFYDISAVLMSSSYFFNFKDAFKTYPQWSAADELISKAALYSDTLASSIIGSSESTWLLPNNDALKPIAAKLMAAPAGELAQFMEYHVLPSLRAVPGGWQNGGKVDTKLPGHSIHSKLGTTTATDPFTGATVNDAPLLTLIPEVGIEARATIYNIYTGKSIIIAINEPLTPNTGISKLLGSAVNSGRRRSLLQRHRQSHANNWAAQNTQRAIRAAAAGNIPVSAATRAGVNNAQLARGNCINCLRWANTW